MAKFIKPKRILLLILLVSVIASAYYFLPRYTKYHLPLTAFKQSRAVVNKQDERAIAKAKQLKKICLENGYNINICFIADMSLHSGIKRFFVVDLVKDSVLSKGLVAHGSCNTEYLDEAEFGNTVGCGCSALGKYKVSYKYEGRFGDAYKLVGLDTSNNNSFDRCVVLHGYSCVPDDAPYPQPICNSLGCPMVSYNFLQKLSGYINKSTKPIILWMIN